jgi:hypothetical protein
MPGRFSVASFRWCSERVGLAAPGAATLGAAGHHRAAGAQQGEGCGLRVVAPGGLQHDVVGLSTETGVDEVAEAGRQHPLAAGCVDNADLFGDVGAGADGHVRPAVLQPLQQGAGKLRMAPLVPAVGREHTQAAPLAKSCAEAWRGTQAEDVAAVLRVAAGVGAQEGDGDADAGLRKLHRACLFVEPAEDAAEYGELVLGGEGVSQRSNVGEGLEGAIALGGGEAVVAVVVGQTHQVEAERRGVGEFLGPGEEGVGGRSAGGPEA